MRRIVLVLLIELFVFSCQKNLNNFRDIDKSQYLLICNELKRIAPNKQTLAFYCYYIGSDNSYDYIVIADDHDYYKKKCLKLKKNIEVVNKRFEYTNDKNKWIKIETLFNDKKIFDEILQLQK